MSNTVKFSDAIASRADRRERSAYFQVVTQDEVVARPRARDCVSNPVGTNMLSTASASRYPARYLATGYPDAHAYTHAHAHEEEREWVHFFIQTFGREPNRFDETDVKFYLDKGMSEDVVILAIRASMDARNPSWKYATTVLKNCLNEGVFDSAGFYGREEKFREERETKKQKKNNEEHLVPAQRYTQREYSREELYALFDPI